MHTPPTPFTAAISKRIGPYLIESDKVFWRKSFFSFWVHSFYLKSLWINFLWFSDGKAWTKNLPKDEWMNERKLPPRCSRVLSFAPSFVHSFFLCRDPFTTTAIILGSITRCRRSSTTRVFSFLHFPRPPNLFPYNMGLWRYCIQNGLLYHI